MITIGDKQYVTADEILTTEATNFGSNLQDVTDNLGKSVQRLQSEVKWLYKYGGSGSGVGGGPGISGAAWAVRATLNGSPVGNEGIAKLPNPDVYILTVSISKHGGGYYTYNIRQNGASLTQTQTFTPDDGKNYSIEMPITCATNGNLTITVVNDSGEDQVIAFQYVTNAFIGDVNLVNAKGNKITDAEILLSNAIDNLYLDFQYVAVFPVSVGYKIIDFNGKVYEGEANCPITGKSVFKFSPTLATDLVNERYLKAYSGDISKPTTYKVSIHYNVYDETGATIIEQDKSIQISIIPNELFLSLTSDSITLSDTAVTSSSDLIGIKTINIKVFEGPNTRSSYNYYYKFYQGDLLLQETEQTEIEERATIPLTFNCSDVGAYHVTFYVRNSNSIGAWYQRTVYWYVNPAEVDYAWYPNNIDTNVDLACINYFRAGTTRGGFVGKESSSIIGLSTASLPREYSLNTETWSGRDLICSIGLQLNSINDVNSPILQLISYDQWEAEQSNIIISLYPNKIMYGSNIESNIFIPRQENLDSADLSSYHLVTIYKRFIESANNENYYELVVYIDGIIEKALQSLIVTENVYTKLRLCPSNININYIEVSSINSLIRESATSELKLNKEAQFTDVDIVKAYYTYKMLILGQIANTNLQERLKTLEFLKEYTFNIDTSLVEVANSGSISTIGASCGVASLVLGAEASTRFFNLNPIDWMTKSYEAGAKLKSDPKYINNIEYTSFNSIDQLVIEQLIYQAPNATSQQVISAMQGSRFAIDIQGTSTRENRSKNFELSLSLIDDDGATQYPVFSPNFDINNPDTFLPESSFTLKADVVDSSHSNNTCLGDFINKNTEPFNTYATAYKGHIKQCLRGFPVLVYLRLPAEDFDPAVPQYVYYYLGIYNFNLGRNSAYNLGYKDASVFLDDSGQDTLMPKVENGGFIQTYVRAEEYNTYNPNLSIAEVQEKDVYFDFSQFDDKILFNNVYPMLGDFVPENLTSENRNTLTRLIENISKSGGFIFEQLRKTFGDIHEGYHGIDKNGIFKNQVPDYRKQYTRPSSDDNLQEFLLKPEDEWLTGNLEYEPGVALIRSLIVGSDTQLPLLDYQSLVEYYTICMAFGLVDSVVKNMNLKSFYRTKYNGLDRALYYTAFYDMDTGLDLGNQSEDISYFAFSDYWYAQDSRDTEIDLNKSLSIVYRDYYPNTANVETGYDVPSSYLFAIAKYAKIFVPELTTSPRELWAKWRSKGGILETSKKFLNNYYNNHLGNTSEQLFNLNYRAKYFILERDTANHSEFYNIDNFKKLTGRRLNKVDWWLSNRFRILDAYFDLDGYRKNIYSLKYNAETDTVAMTPKGDIDWVDTNYFLPAVSPEVQNEDIKYLDTIFTDSYGTTYTFKAQTTKVGIQAQNYTPTTVLLGESRASYMLTNSNKIYNIVMSDSSNKTARMYGSYFWTGVSNILPFVDATSGILTVRSPFITTLKGTDGIINGFNFIKCYSLKELNLTSPDYKGVLNLTNSGVGSNVNYPQLSKIVINNNSIDLTADGLYIDSLDISNIKRGTVKVSNCNQLNNVKFGTFVYEWNQVYHDYVLNLEKSTKIISDLIQITPYNALETLLDSQEIKQLTLRNTQKGSSITIKDDPTLQILSLSGFSTVNISGCSNLKEIHFTDIEHLSLHNVGLVNLDLRDCPKIQDIDVSNNQNMTAVYLRYEVRSSLLTSMNISNTKISTLTWINDNGDQVDINGNPSSQTNLGVIDLVGATGLTKSTTAFSCKGNTGVTTIKFDNLPTNLSASKYLKDNLSKAIRVGSFSGCTALERIYGNIIITTSDAFTNCVKFSIHGTNLNSIRYNNKSVVNGSICYMPYQLHTNNPDVIPQSKYFDFGTEPMDVLFQEGNNVTNMSFDIVDFTTTFMDTAYTWWDVNYFFSNANSVSNPTTPLTFYRTFRVTRKNDDSHNRVQGYNISRYLLHNIHIKSWNSPFTNVIGTGYKRLWSPTKKADGTFNEDGFMTPIWRSNPTQWNWNSRDSSGGSTYSIAIAIDNDFFQGCNSTFTKLYQFTNQIIVGVNDPNHSFIVSESSPGSGDITRLFDPIIGLTSMEEVGFYFIDFSTLTVPNTVTSMNNAIYSTYATGELDLTKVFKTGSKMGTIKNRSFVVELENTNVEPATMLLKNNTLENLKVLTVLGAPENLQQESYGSCFSGKGLHKYVIAIDFPYNIFNGHNNLHTINGFFAGARELNGANTIVSLPVNMFENTSSIANLQYCFYGMRFYYKLSPFSSTSCNFNKLSNLTNMAHCFDYGQFYYDEYSTSDGEIKTPICYQRGFVPYQFLKTPRESISNLKYCFANSNWQPYVNETPTNEWDFDGVHGITDSTYSKYDELSTISDWYNFKICKHNGAYSNIVNYANYCCAPDLLQYVAARCDVSYLFAGCGSSFSNGNNTVVIDDESNQLGIGLKGRIPPYLFRGSKIINVTGFFTNCKALSQYYENLTKENNTVTGFIAHQIPKTLFTQSTVVITNMNEMFSGCCMSALEMLRGKFPNRVISTNGMFKNTMWTNYINADVYGANCPLVLHFPADDTYSEGLFLQIPTDISNMFSQEYMSGSQGYRYNANPNTYIQLGQIIGSTQVVNTTVKGLFSGYTDNYVSGDAGDQFSISIMDTNYNYHYHTGRDQYGRDIWKRYSCIKA